MKVKLTFGTIMIQSVLWCVCAENTAQDNPVVTPTPNDSGRYVNGSYDGQTARDYEGYTTYASVEVQSGEIASVDWRIHDDSRNRDFDSTYEQVYTGIPLYIQQCKDNMVGMKAFGPELIRTQNVDSVDNITGATWCWYKFRQVVKIALKDARKDTLDSR